MNKTKYLARSLAIVLGAALCSGLTGCIHERRTVYAEPPPPYPERRVVVQDDYVYYPGYQVYYSSSRRQYIYLEGRSWVSRPAPPRVSVDVLFASPSVRLDFHDAPSLHHSRVVKQYPRHWAPPGSSPNRGRDKHDNGKGNDHGDRR